MDLAPPASTTGVLRTEGGSGGAQPPAGEVRCLVDYVRVTWPDPWPAEEILTRFAPEDSWVELPYGGLGYRRSWVLPGSGLRLFAEGQPGMGVHLEAKGKGCRWLEAAGVEWESTLPQWRREGAKLSRFDLALDDHVGLLDLAQVVAATRRREFTARYRKWKIEEYYEEGVDRPGYVVRFGVGKSDTQIRIYDKALEQKRVDLHWVRVELEARDGRAEEMCTVLLERGMQGVAGAIRGLLEFKMPTRDSNRRRWPAAPWWDAFLGHSAKVILGREPRKRTLEDIRQWLWDQVAPSLALIVEQAGGDLDGVLRMIETGKLRWSAAQRALLTDWLQRERELKEWLEECRHRAEHSGRTRQLG